MTKTFSTKTLLASTTIAFGLLAVIGSAQAQQGPSATRKIEVVSSQPAAGNPAFANQQVEPQQSETDERAPIEAAATQPDVSQDGPPAAAGAFAGTETAPSQVEPKFAVSEEAKRLNRQRYIERYETRYGNEPSYNAHYAEPRYNAHYEPRYVEPHYKQHYVAPRYVAPHYVAPHYVAPKYVAPKYVAPHYVAPKYVAPSHYVQREAYAHRYQAAPKYGHAQHRVEYRSHRGY